MSKTSCLTALFAILFAGCAQLPPSPQDLQAKKFEVAPGTAAIYIVRANMDSREVGTLLLDDTVTVATYRNTYYRWDVTPGRHRIAGFAQEYAAITLETEPGKLYFVQHTVMGTRKTGPTYINLDRIDERQGRAMVLGSRGN